MRNTFGSDNSLGLLNAPFPAKITAMTAGTGAQSGQNLYTWKEQVIDPSTGKLQDANPGRKGDNNGGWAVEINNAVVSLPQYRTLRSRGFAAGSPIYEFGDGSGLNFSIFRGSAITTGTYNDYNPTGANGANIWFLDPGTGAVTLTGIVPYATPYDGMPFWIFNNGNFNLLLVNDASGVSSAGNLLFCPETTDLTLTPGGGASLFYDLTNGGFRVLTFSSGYTGTQTIVTGWDASTCQVTTSNFTYYCGQLISVV